MPSGKGAESSPQSLPHTFYTGFTQARAQGALQSSASKDEGRLGGREAGRFLPSLLHRFGALSACRAISALRSLSSVLVHRCTTNSLGESRAMGRMTTRGTPSLHRTWCGVGGSSKHTHSPNQQRTIRLEILAEFSSKPPNPGHCKHPVGPPLTTQEKLLQHHCDPYSWGQKGATR